MLHRPAPSRHEHPREDPFWTRPAAALLEGLGTSPAGLTEAEAARRLAAQGRNIVAEGAPAALALKVLRRLVEPLVAILIVAALVSGLTGDWPGFGIILGIVGISVAMDVLQEYRAEQAAARLRDSVAVRATVRRDGRARPVPVEDLVPGDVVDLAAGALVPADGLVLVGEGAHANEALLTGEPYPVAKRPGPCAGTTPAEAANALFAGTALVAGSATMLVVATGHATRLGGVAAALAARRPATAFERGLRGLGLLILRLTAFLVLFVLLAHLAFHRPALESFLFAVALAVGLTPELLPMVTTVTLSRGALRMARKQVVVKRLAAIHDLGAMDVLCTDKTGTLTEARIALADATSPEVLRMAALNAGLASGVPTPLDAAILAAQPVPPGWRALAEAPFGFERRRSSVLVAGEGQGGATRLLVVKGAPEAVLAACTHAEGRAFDRAALLAEAEARGAEGLRLLGIAVRAVPEGEAVTGPEAERDLAFLGFCAFLDPPKQSAAAAVARLAALGIRTKIVSGDAAPVVRHLVAALGLPAEGLLTGEEIARLDDHALAARVEQVDLYARVSPDQKRRILLALKARGHTVGFIGDGINDAPAIHAADAGISVQEATEVARAAADLILLAPDLSVLAEGVEEGRRTYANVMKYVRMGTSSNFGNMLSMAVASLAIPFLPLLPAQILLNNLLYDLSEIGIPFDAVDREDLAAPHAWDMRAVLRFTLVMGPLSSVFDLATFALLLWGFSAAPEAFRTAWFVESMATQILVIFLIRTAGPAWRAAWPHPVLAATSLGALAAALALALGPVAPVLGFAPLPGPLLAALLALVLLYLAAAERLKRIAVRRA
ncbi:magnesium-translocating P-type ATPase [Paracraurococcus lichenis]|uniref:Magnesium-transporting ATPase, P-type 1 n=1 Tax=Paracraurococcus lichenis TaxID=3064888 RepID=A0ABT9DZX9_9PROT|nr:magnesium-translocating P-type ATPase [Paracraurococcus sp. LOR1-02]MDO9709465.1 magnesium-translocating P-type ATPase [Paracraurococcus sp. LOR1-02]